MELEDGNEDLFARKRLYIKTKHANNILDSFKIIVKGKVFQIRAKELFVWSPSFKEVPEVVHCSDDESVKNEADINVVDNTVNNEGEESDSEAVSDTFFEWSNQVKLWTLCDVEMQYEGLISKSEHSEAKEANLRG
ncbi:hypothetical protein Tco_0816462 [Tanacetum coccineum]